MLKMPLQHLISISLFKKFVKINHHSSFYIRLIYKHKKGVFASSCRWLKTMNINPASEAKQRVVAKKWSGEDWVAEETPFLFQVKDKKGHFEVLSAPWAYIKDLTSNVSSLLDKLKK